MVSGQQGYWISNPRKAKTRSVSLISTNLLRAAKEGEFDGKVYSLNILVNELMSIKVMVDKAEHASQLVEEWRRKYSHLEEEKNSLAQEMFKLY